MNEFLIVNKAETAYLKIHGNISQWKNSSQEFVNQIDKLLAEDVKDVEMYINTQGGSMFEANEIANQIKRFSGTKTAICGAIVASAGGYLITYFDKIIAQENTQIMMHNPIVGGEFKSLEDFESGKELYENLRNMILDQFERKTNLSRKALAKMLDKETWINTEKAKEYGLVDQITDAKNITNQIEIHNTNHNKSEMKEITIKLGLPENASLEDINGAIQKLTTNAAKALGAIAKSKGHDAANIENLALSDFDNTLKLVNSLHAISSSSAAQGTSQDDDTDYNDSSSNGASNKNSKMGVEMVNAFTKSLTNMIKEGASGQKDKTFNQMTPKEREDLYDSNPEKYQELLTNYSKN